MNYAELKERLIDQGRSQKWLSRKMGVSRFIVNRWLNGVDKMPNERRVEIEELLK